MIENIKRFFERQLSMSQELAKEQRDHRIQLSCAALLIELSSADMAVSVVEVDKIRSILSQVFGLTGNELNELIALADEENQQATSLYEFTRLINEHYQEPEKFKLVEAMWQVAFADGRLDKYEDHLIRKVCELIHVRHSDFVRLKSKVKESLD